MAALLDLRQVVKTYRRGGEEVVALDGIDLQVGRGETVAVVGRSGSGKSTLLHLAGGLDVPDTGRVVVDGQDLATLSATDRAALRRRRIGFIFQFFHLLPDLTVAENVELPLVLEGQRRRRRGGTTPVGDLLDQVGLTARARHRPSELSGGEMQRAAIARALVADPALVLADEPTGNLDSASAGAVLEVLREVVSATGTTLVMVTHDQAATRLTDRVLELVDGQLR